MFKVFVQSQLFVSSSTEHQHSHHLGPIDGKQETHVAPGAVPKAQYALPWCGHLSTSPHGTGLPWTANSQKIKGWIFKSYKRPSAAIHSPCRLWRGQLLIDLKQFLQRYRHCQSAWSSRQVLRLGHHLRCPPDEQRGKVSQVRVEGYSWEHVSIFTILWIHETFTTVSYNFLC